jgi:hypothetical protein
MAGAIPPSVANSATLYQWRKTMDKRVSTTTEHEAEQVQRANATELQPIVFVHGLWLLPSSWDRWAKLFEEAGYTTLTPGWPDDPDTVEEANAHPEVFAHKTVGQMPITSTSLFAVWTENQQSLAIRLEASWFKS